MGKVVTVLGWLALSLYVLLLISSFALLFFTRPY